MTNEPFDPGGNSGDGDGYRFLDDPQDHYRPEGEIRCVFYSLVARNEALLLKWNGGLKDYWLRYGAEYNDSLTVTSYMGPDWDEQYDKLVTAGLKQGKDFIIFDACDVILMKDHTPFPFRANWLGGYVLKGGVMIYLKN